MFLNRVNTHFILSLICILSACLTSVKTHANFQQSTWQEYKNENNIHIRFKQIPQTKLLEVNACLNTTGTPHRALQFLTSPEKIQQWLDNVESVTPLELITPSRSIMSTTLKGMWPVKPRQAFVYSDIYVENNGTIVITQTDAGKRFIADKGYIRIVLQYATWTIIPIENNSITICYNVSADPQGKIPSWLANRVALDSMYKTLRNVQRQFPTNKVK